MLGLVEVVDIVGFGLGLVEEVNIVGLGLGLAEEVNIVGLGLVEEVDSWVWVRASRRS